MNARISGHEFFTLPVQHGKGCQSALPGNSYLKWEGQNSCRCNRRDVVLLLIDRAQDNCHHMLHGCLQLCMALGTDCTKHTRVRMFLEEAIQCVVEIWSCILSQTLTDTNCCMFPRNVKLVKYLWKLHRKFASERRRRASHRWSMKTSSALPG